MALGLLASSSFQTAWAQPVAPVPPRGRPESPSPLPPAADPLQLPLPEREAPEELPLEVPGTITVSRFEFVGNTAFSDRELAAVTQPFTQRPLSFAELLQARSAVTQLYVDNGYATSGAYIPPQTLENGTVTLRIVEGSLEAIDVQVEGKLAPAYVRDRAALGAGTPLNLRRLLEALQLLQLDPLIGQISAELSAGVRPGTSRLDIRVEAAPSFRAGAILDNGRNPQVGSFRRGVELEDASLLGYGDRLSATYLNTDGSDDVTASYTFPLNPHNGSLKLEYREIWSQIVEPPFNVLDIEGNYRQYLLSFRQPVLQAPNRELALGLTFDRQESDSTFLDGLPFLSPSADLFGRTRISTLRFFQEWLQRSERDALAVRSEFSFGVNLLGTTTPFDAGINPNSPDRDYFSWRGQLQWGYLLAADTLLVARTDFQLADRPLVALEQFALGGLGSVEGYRQNTLLTDSGIFASLELRLPLLRWPRQEAALQIVPFLDFGKGWNSGSVPNPPVDTLASVGVGLQWQQGEQFSARIDYARRLGKIPYVEGNTWQDNGIVFTIHFSPSFD